MFYIQFFKRNLSDMAEICVIHAFDNFDELAVLLPKAVFVAVGWDVHEAKSGNNTVPKASPFFHKSILKTVDVTGSANSCLSLIHCNVNVHFRKHVYNKYSSKHRPIIYLVCGSKLTITLSWMVALTTSGTQWYGWMLWGIDSPNWALSTEIKQILKWSH